MFRHALSQMQDITYQHACLTCITTIKMHKKEENWPLACACLAQSQIFKNSSEPATPWKPPIASHKQIQTQLLKHVFPGGIQTRERHKNWKHFAWTCHPRSSLINKMSSSTLLLKYVTHFLLEPSHLFNLFICPLCLSAFRRGWCILQSFLWC